MSGVNLLRAAAAILVAVNWASPAIGQSTGATGQDSSDSMLSESVIGTQRPTANVPDVEASPAPGFVPQRLLVSLATAQRSCVAFRSEGWPAWQSLGIDESEQAQVWQLDKDKVSLDSVSLPGQRPAIRFYWNSSAGASLEWLQPDNNEKFPGVLIRVGDSRGPTLQYDFGSDCSMREHRRLVYSSDGARSLLVFDALGTLISSQVLQPGVDIQGVEPDEPTSDSTELPDLGGVISPEDALPALRAALVD